MRKVFERLRASLAELPARSSVRVLLGGSAVLCFAGVLWAHAVVVPAASTTRAYETYTLRVPNEKDVPTTRVEIRFPPEVFVVSFAETSGWELRVERDETGRAIGAAWAGTLPPHRFVELKFVAVNPTEATTLVWPVDQVYAGPEGEEVVRWAGPADSDFPASRTEIRSPAAASGERSAAATESRPERSVLTPIALLVSTIALVVSLGVLRSRRS